MAVEVWGCFWHGCPHHFKTPATNTDWWVRKISQNRVRDAAKVAELRKLGWTVVIVWEHDAVDEAVQAVVEALEQRAP